MGDNPSEPSTSLSHSACSIGPSVGSEETSSWQDGKRKRHNGSIEPQTTPVDLLRPSDDKATGNRTNEPLDRQHCVVVQGLSESDAPTPKERISADLNMLQQLLNEMLNSNEKITIRAAFRIGKKNRLKTLRRQLRDPSASSLSVHLRITEIFEMASRMRQARDRQRESIALSGSNPGKSVVNIFRHRSYSKRGHELPPMLNDNKVFLTDDTDKA
nr:unnamed protein product [Spirometra erinaceieuropaei]